MVAGVKYELVFDAGLSTCANDGTSHTQEACPVSSTSWYTVVVVDQAWMDPRYTLLSHTMEASPPRLSSAPSQRTAPHHPTPRAATTASPANVQSAVLRLTTRAGQSAAEADDEGWQSPRATERQRAGRFRLLKIGTGFGRSGPREPCGIIKSRSAVLFQLPSRRAP